MGLTTFGNFLKFSMFFFNTIILIAGCGLLGFGVYTRSNDDRITKFSSIMGSHLYTTVSLIIISGGGTIIFLSFLGCCGAIKEVKCMLGTFFILLLVMLFGLIISGAVAYAFRNEIGDHILHELYSSLNTSYGVRNDNSVTEAWDVMQKLFSCCGVYGGANSSTSWAFYRHTPWYLNQSDIIRQYVPESCCANAVGENRTLCVGTSTSFSHLIPATPPPVLPGMENSMMYTEGCYTALTSFLTKNINVFFGLGIGMCLIMMLAMIFAVCLCHRITDEY